MGAPGAFEYRRKELETILSKEEVSDEEVALSFLDIISPHSIRNGSDTSSPYDGILLQYLLHAQIIVVIGDSLFVHGSIQPYNLGYFLYDSEYLVLTLTYALL